MTTTIANVKNILGTELEDDNITAYIATADNLISAVMSGQTITDEVLEDMATYLTAHLISISKERQSSKMEIDDTRNTFTGSYGQGLSSTSYGQMVLALDYTGSFASSNKRKAVIYVIPETDES